MTLELRAHTRLQPSAVLAIAGAATQLAYPLTSGEARAQLTIAIVLLFAGAALWHAGQTYGARVTAALAASTVGLGFAVECVGVATGWPFGHYTYGGDLGPRAFGVPVLIAFAWTMLAWPAAVAARRLASTLAARIALGAWALAAWDLFLDPQMTSAGFWRWSAPGAALPGVPGVPLSDYAGWLLVALVISAVLQLVLRSCPTRDDLVPLATYVWTWASSAVALAAFLGLPAAAAYGFAGMGVIAAPLLRRS